MNKFLLMRDSHWRLRLFACAMLAGGPSPAWADTLPGPVPAEIVRVIDGDTVRVRATIWIDLRLDVLVRIRGIDAPELNGECREEREGAAAATAALAEILGAGPLKLTEIEEDKYFGRVVADIATGDVISVAAAMLETGLVRPYDGGTRLPWCPAAVAGGP